MAPALLPVKKMKPLALVVRTNTRTMFDLFLTLYYIYYYPPLARKISKINLDLVEFFLFYLFLK
ncbi:uncharacterized protein DS421_14g457260 [Arachis hypogaea]|nr:uncharacterized protein DS421_14g457260 [Arachis hypogaea]